MVLTGRNWRLDLKRPLWNSHHLVPPPPSLLRTIAIRAESIDNVTEPSRYNDRNLRELSFPTRYRGNQNHAFPLETKLALHRPNPGHHGFPSCPVLHSKATPRHQGPSVHRSTNSLSHRELASSNTKETSTDSLGPCFTNTPLDWKDTQRTTSPRDIPRKYGKYQQYNARMRLREHIAICPNILRRPDRTRS